MKPTIGRIVHYVTRIIEGEGLVSRAALVAGIEPDGENQELSLCIFHVGGIEWAHQIPYNEAGDEVATWHWPPRV